MKRSTEWDYHHPYGHPLRRVLTARRAKKGSRTVLLALECGHRLKTRVDGWLWANIPSTTPLMRCRHCPEGSR